MSDVAWFALSCALLVAGAWGLTGWQLYLLHREEKASRMSHGLPH